MFEDAMDINQLLGKSNKGRKQFESRFLTEIRDSMLHFYPGGMWIKIPDEPVKQRPKPFDALYMWHGKVLAIEAKVHRSKNAFSFSRIREHQIEGLENMAQNGFGALVVIKVQLPNSRNKEIWILSPDELREMMHVGIKSVKERHSKLKWDGKYFELPM